MNRYKDTKMGQYVGKEKGKNTHAKLNTTIYAKVPEKNNDLYVIATEGDRCDNLANQFYNDASLWWYIAKANNISTMNIPAGTSLRIPNSIEYARGS